MPNAPGNIIKHGLKWSAAAQAVTQIGKIVRWSVLFYFLTPADFGLFALALLILGLPQILTDGSIGNALIQISDISQKMYSSVFWLIITLSGVNFLFFFCTADFIAAFFDESAAAKILVFLSFAYLVHGLGKTAEFVLRKNMNFSYLAKTEVVGFAADTVVTLVLAGLGYGVWSLAIGLCVSYCVTTPAYLRKVPYSIVLEYSRTEIQKIRSFARDLTLSSLFTWGMRYADDLIIGYFFGKSALGVYDRAYQLVHLPMRLVANRVNRVLYPVYTSAREKTEDIRRLHLKVTRWSALLYVPFAVGMILFAEPMINLALPKSWRELAFFLPVLTIGGIFHAFLNMNNSIFLATGRSDLQLKYRILTRSIIFVSYVIGAFWGVEGVAIAYTVGSVIAFFPETYGALRLAGISLHRYRYEFKPVSLFLVTVIGAALVTRYLTDEIPEILIADTIFFTTGTILLFSNYFRELKTSLFPKRPDGRGV